MTLPIIGITMGDPSGIGPEIIIGSYSHDTSFLNCSLLVIGNSKRLIETSKILKKDINISTDKTIIWELFIKILDKLFDERNPPDEIIVIARFKEWNILISKIFRIIKIPNVNNEYSRAILKDCFKISALLKDIKFVKDFLKLLSKISINKIIENKKYNPPTHWEEDLHKIKLWSICLIFSKIVNPVEVKPEIASK